MSSAISMKFSWVAKSWAAARLSEIHPRLHARAARCCCGEFHSQRTVARTGWGASRL
jgi:hypothetical protein